MLHISRPVQRYSSVFPIVALCGMALVGFSDAALAQSESAKSNDGATESNSTSSPTQQTKLGKIYLQGSLKVTDERGRTKPMSGIIEVDLETGNCRKLVNAGESPRISPDGQTMIYSTESKIRSCSLADPLRSKIFAEVSGSLAWLPDGKSFILTKSEWIEEKDKEGWRDETIRVELKSGAKVRVPVPSSDAVDDVSPDGKWVVTCSDRQSPKGSGYQLYVMRLDGTEQRKIIQDGLNVYSRFSPDGGKILFTHSGGQLRTVNFDGTDERTILSQRGHLGCPDHAVWSPDGKQIAVICFDWQVHEDGKEYLGDSSLAHYRIEIIDADGSNKRVLNFKDATVEWLNGPLDWK